MDSISGINSSLNMAGEALGVHAVGMQVAAHNIANVSTDGFVPQRATYATGSNGMGVELESVRGRDLPLGRLPGGEHFLMKSGTELAKEIPQMISAQRGFEANAATIRAADEMNGSLLNIIA